MDYKTPLSLAAESAIEFLTGVESRSISPPADAATLRERIGGVLPAEGMKADDVVRDLVRDTAGGILGSQSGRFFAWVIGGSLPSALAADWLTSAWDQNAAIFATGPAAAIVEEVSGEWLKQLLNLPPAASFAFVTGCQMAHATCLAAARHALLRKRGWDVGADGLFGAPAIRVISSERRHASIDRALRLLGVGSNALVLLEPGDDETLEEAALENALKAGDAPAIVLLQAGDINTGAFDRFSTLIPIARRYDAWVHVDGAFGLWASASAKFKHLTQGIEFADSWATDGHKTLNVPFDSGYAFVADTQAHRASMSIRAPYFEGSDHARDQIDWNPEWSRRARGFSTYAALRELGKSGVSRIVERTCSAASELVYQLALIPGVEVLWRPIINQGLVRFLDPRPNATEQDHDAETERVIGNIVRSGEAFFGGTTWRARRAMRVSVVNWRTDEESVRRAVDAVRLAVDRSHLSGSVAGTGNFFG